MWVCVIHQHTPCVLHTVTRWSRPSAAHGSSLLVGNGLGVSSSGACLFSVSAGAGAVPRLRAAAETSRGWCTSASTANRDWRADFVEANTTGAFCRNSRACRCVMCRSNILGLLVLGNVCCCTNNESQNTYKAQQKKHRPALIDAFVGVIKTHNTMGRTPSTISDIIANTSASLNSYYVELAIPVDADIPDSDSIEEILKVGTGDRCLGRQKSGP